MSSTQAGRFVEVKVDSGDVRAGELEGDLCLVGCGFCPLLTVVNKGWNIHYLRRGFLGSSVVSPRNAGYVLSLPHVVGGLLSWQPRGRFQYGDVAR